MSSPIVFRRIAKAEMDEAIAWYEKQRVNLGIELAAEIDRILEKVSQNAKQFPQIRGNIRRALLRRFPYGLHFIHEEHRVVIVAVFHVKRNPQLLEDR
jgi:plasmid stabilization system protein ParE